MQHSPTALLLYLGMTARALLAQAAASPDGLPRSPTAGPTRLPYVVRLHELDETAAVRLRDALAEIPGVEAVAALSGDERAVQVHARDGHFVSRAQVEDVVRRLRLALDAFEIPAWARMRFYVVEASGGGWGAATLAREAMQELDGIATLRMSGTRAAFTLEDGVTFDEEVVAAAFAARDMTLETFAKRNDPRPQSVRRYAVKSGLGWANRARRVREALNRLAGVQDTFVDEDVALLLEPGAAPDLDAIADVLRREEIEVDRVATSSEQPF